MRQMLVISAKKARELEIQISKINPHLGDETILYPVWDYDNVEPDRRHIFSYGKN